MIVSWIQCFLQNVCQLLISNQGYDLRSSTFHLMYVYIHNCLSAWPWFTKHKHVTGYLVYHNKWRNQIREIQNSAPLFTPFFMPDTIRHLRMSSERGRHRYVTTSTSNGSVLGFPIISGHCTRSTLVWTSMKRLFCNNFY